MFWALLAVNVQLHLGLIESDVMQRRQLDKAWKFCGM